MIIVSGEKIGTMGKADLYDKVEVIDDEHKHRFIFIQTKDQGVQVTIVPYGGDLE